MKGGGRGKEPPAAGEVGGKRPKRKCLQWHPLLSKKALDFSEEEEEEEEEELEKVSLGLPGQVGQKPTKWFDGVDFVEEPLLIKLLLIITHHHYGC